MKKFLWIVIALFPFTGNSQPNFEAQKMGDFLTEVNNFRHSLYPELTKMDIESLNSFPNSMDTSSALYNQCKQFYVKNHENIKAYQKFELEKHFKTSINLSNFIEDPILGNNNSIIDTIFLFHNSNSLLRLLFYDPISLTSVLAESALASVQSVEELGRSYTINSLAQPLAATKMLKNNVYEIILDEYRYAFILHYNIDNQQINMIKVLRRK